MILINRTRLLQWNFNPLGGRIEDWSWFIVKVEKANIFPGTNDYTVFIINNKAGIKYEEMFMWYRPNQIAKAVESLITEYYNKNRPIPDATN